MAKFAIGDSVQSVNSNEVGVICQVYPKRPGKQLYDVIFENGQKKPALESTPIPITIYDDPFDCCAKGIYGCTNVDERLYTIRATSYGLSIAMLGEIEMKDTAALFRNIADAGPEPEKKGHWAANGYEYGLTDY